MVKLGNDWDEILSDEFEKPYYLELREFLKEEYRTKTIYPNMNNILEALKRTSYKDTKVLICHTQEVFIMAITIGINGFGRIGRVAFRIAINQPEQFKLCGINVRNADLDYILYMIRYDSIFGRFQGTLERYEDGIIVNGEKIRVYSENDAADIRWGECGAEYIIDATGAYCTTEKAMAHIKGGAKKVIISAPAKDQDTPTFVMGINHELYQPSMHVVSNASCTTNCLAPLCKVLEDNYGFEYGLMSTIHSATAKQKVVDCRSLKDWRTGRAVFGNLIPSTTGAAKAISLVIPTLKDRMNGISYRVPTSDVSIVDLNVALKIETSYEDICKKMKEASETYLKGILDYIDDEVVSSDFIGDSHASSFDAREGIQINGHFFKLISFYDNEWGYTNQIFRLIKHMYQVDNGIK